MNVQNFFLKLFRTLDSDERIEIEPIPKGFCVKFKKDVGGKTYENSVYFNFTQIDLMRDKKNYQTKIQRTLESLRREVIGS